MRIRTLLCFAVALAPAAPSPTGTLLIVNLREHNLIFLDPQSKNTLATVSDGIGNVSGHEITLSKDGRTAYIPIYSDAVLGDPGTAGSTIDVIDLVARRRKSTLDLGRPVRPHSAVFGPDGLLYVTAELANSIEIVNTNKRAVVGTIPTGEPQSHMLVLSPDGRRGYTSNVDSGTVSVLDIPNRKLLTIVPVTKRIQRIAVSPDGRWVFTSDWDAPRVAVIDTTTNTLSRWIPVGGIPFAARPTPDGKYLLVVESKADKGHLDVIDLKTNQSIHAWDLDGQPFGIFIHEHTAYMTCIVTGRVEILDLNSWTLQPPIDLTPGVDGVAWLDPQH